MWKTRTCRFAQTFCNDFEIGHELLIQLNLARNLIYFKQYEVLCKSIENRTI